MTKDRDPLTEILSCVLYRIRTIKMAASIATKLLAKINAVPYKQILPALHGNSGISEVKFSRTTLASRFLLDTRRWLDSSYMNPNTMFEYFGLFSNETSKQVRKNMIMYLGLNKKKGYENCAILKNSWIALGLQSIDAKKWLEDMKKLDTPGDKIALYTLCRMYHRHCLIFTKVKSWCTIDDNTGMDEEAMLDKCDIVLLFIELGVFGELKTRPYAPPPRHVYLHKATADIPTTQPIPPPITLTVAVHWTSDLWTVLKTLTVLLVITPVTSAALTAATMMKLVLLKCHQRLLLHHKPIPFRMIIP